MIPALRTKIEGIDDTKQTVLINIGDVAQSLNINALYILKFFAMELNAKRQQYDLQRDVGILTGSYLNEKMQQLLKQFIEVIILCPSCKLPHLQHNFIQHNFTNNDLLQHCSSCGWNGYQPSISSHQIKQYMSNHPFQPLKIDSDYYRDENVFLRGCVNFESIRDNFELFIYGYIHFTTNFPMDIIWLLFDICYDVNKFNMPQDYWCLDSIQDTAKMHEDGTIQWSSSLIKVLFTDRMLADKVIRKIWTIQIINIASGFKVQMIQLDDYNDYNDKGKFVLVNTTKSDKYNLLTNGGFIRILMINYKSSVLVKVAINNKIRRKTFEAKGVELHKRKCRLILTLSPDDEIRFLPETAFVNYFACFVSQKTH